ncbi:MAG: Pyridoxine/pyridoxamine 5'-phosphate oxidase [Ignavibacteria bacterium]|nr:Pyridoxine/pyridoxamine 5'-phosphate oxidase [Ignavibacteria bacterium]
MKFEGLTKKDFKNKTLRQLVANFRNEYVSGGLQEKDLLDNPILQFENWFEDAVKNKISEPNIMHLSTADKTGRPSGRIVLLKGFDEDGFVFYTNYMSRKGNELLQNNYGALTFLWMELYRQVRVEGRVNKVSAEESDKYFHSRPRGSQISALASEQSKVISGRDELEKIFKELDEKYRDKEVPRPENWGGYRMIPEEMEFWQGRVNRLHDRIQYILQDNKIWKKQRLSP